MFDRVDTNGDGVIVAQELDAMAEEAARELELGRGADPEWEDAWTEEIDALAPVRIGRGYRFTFAYTVDDLETVRDNSDFFDAIAERHAGEYDGWEASVN